MAFDFAGFYGPEPALFGGAVAPDGALIAILRPGTSTLADLFTDKDRTPGPNPVACLAGNMTFRSEVGRYDACRSINGVLQLDHIVRDLVCQPDEHEADLDIVAEAGTRSAADLGVGLQTICAFLLGMLADIRGASYEAQDYQNTVNNRTVLQFVKQNLMSYFNQALSGAGVDSAVIRAMGNGTTKFVGGVKCLEWVNVLHNTVLSAGFTTDRQKDHCLSNLYALLACLSSLDRIEASTLTPTGTWTVDTNAVWSGGTARVTSDANAHLDGTITFPASGKIDVVVASVDTASATGVAFPPSAFSVLLDGVVAFTGTAADHTIDTASTVENTGVGRLAVPLAASAGDHTVEILKDGTAGTYLFVDVILRRSSTPPPMLLWPMNAVNYAAVAAGYHRTTTQAEVDAANAAQAALAAQFPQIHVMDISGFDAPTMLGSDGLHCNDRGALFFKNKAQAWGGSLTDFVPGLHALATI